MSRPGFWIKRGERLFEASSWDMICEWAQAGRLKLNDQYSTPQTRELREVRRDPTLSGLIPKRERLLLKRGDREYSAPNYEVIQDWARRGQVSPDDMIYSSYTQLWARVSDLPSITQLIPEYVIKLNDERSLRRGSINKSFNHDTSTSSMPEPTSKTLTDVLASQSATQVDHQTSDPDIDLAESRDRSRDLSSSFHQQSTHPPQKKAPVDMLQFNHAEINEEIDNLLNDIELIDFELDERDDEPYVDDLLNHFKQADNQAHTPDLNDGHQDVQSDHEDDRSGQLSNYKPSDKIDEEHADEQADEPSRDMGYQPDDENYKESGEQAEGQGRMYDAAQNFQQDHEPPLDGSEMATEILLPHLRPSPQDIKSICAPFYDTARLFIAIKDLRPLDTIPEGSVLQSLDLNCQGLSKKEAMRTLRQKLSQHAEAYLSDEVSAITLGAIELYQAQNRLIELLIEVDPYIGQISQERFVIGNANRPKMTSKEAEAMLNMHSCVEHLIRCVKNYKNNQSV